MAQSLWSWEAAQFEKLDTASGVATSHREQRWLVDIEKPHQAWGYRIALPEDAKMYIMWRASLQITDLQGVIMPGIAYFCGTDGIAFQIDAANDRAELRHALPTMVTSRVAVFSARQEISLPFEMQLEINVVTKVCVGSLNGIRVFDVKLPFKSMPSFDEITDLEIITTTPQKDGGGSVCYGELKLQCE